MHELNPQSIFYLNIVLLFPQNKNKKFSIIDSSLPESVFAVLMIPNQCHWIMFHLIKAKIVKPASATRQSLLCLITSAML